MPKGRAAVPQGDLDALREQYATADPLRIRLHTHRLYSERHDDLHDECSREMRLTGRETILDVGPGPGEFEAHLRGCGHNGLLVGVDASSGMCGQAREAAPSARWVVGDAASLPVSAASFDWVVARHMLYHVPDTRGALLEARRVLRPSGAMLVTTNAADSLSTLRRIKVRAIDALGLDEPSVTTSSAFTSSNAPRLLQSVFPHVHVRTLENALVFHEPGPAARYIASAFTSAECATRRHELMTYLTEAVAAEMNDDGVLRDPKSVALYTARVG
jgi:ubiquinone/menaquinone biosynthesis C-methylase UbiE